MSPIHAPYTILDAFIADGLLNQRIQFYVPLKHDHPQKSTQISICANVTQKYRKEVHSDIWKTVAFPKQLNVMAFLQGGPGFPCEVPVSNSGYTKVLLDKGYQLVFYDQRGTGLSSPIEVGTLIDFAAQNSKNAQTKKLRHDTTLALLDYVLNFRADSIVEDMEVVRNSLIGDAQWTLLGQSFGGFCIFTYLSRYSKSLKEVYVTGGVPPIGFTADDVYAKTYERTKERNVHFYEKYPQDVLRVREIVKYLIQNRTELPNGGILSAERFQQLGLSFGASGGTDSLHQLVTKFHHSLEHLGRPSYSVLYQVQEASSFDTNVLYALFQEAIYCDGANMKGPKKSNWAAERLRKLPGNERFHITNALLLSSDPVYFTGEMVFKSMYDDYAELAPLKDLAYALHEYEDWLPLYNVEVLQSITWEDVPILATTYYLDQYVDFDLTMSVKKRLFTDNGNNNLRQYITNEYFHNGLRADPLKVLNSMFKLRHGEYD